MSRIKAKPDIFPAKGEWPYYWITRVSARYTLRLEEALKPRGLDVSRWRVLQSLHEHGALGVSDLADFAILRLNTTTKIVQRMVADGLLDTRVSRKDARVTEVLLTTKGRRQAEIARRLAHELFN